MKTSALKKIIASIFVTGLLVTSVILLINIYKLNILQTSYLVIVIIVISILDALCSFILLNNKTNTIVKIIFYIISIILIGGYIFINKYVKSSITFIEEITAAPETTQIHYDVLIPSNKQTQSICQYSGAKIGFLSTDINKEKANQGLKNNINCIIETQEYDNIGTLIAAVGEEIEAIVLEKSYIELLEENDVPFYAESQVIYSYDIEVPLELETGKLCNVLEEPYVIYISGSDSRGTVRDVARSDTNIVAIINPNTHKILLVTIPRDYYVQLHGTTGVKDKLTHAGVYGINMSINTIEDLLDVKINYYIRASFDALINGVDAIDGIEIYSDQEFTPSHYKKTCHFVQGTQHVDGTCAFAFASERYAYNSGDRHRGQNQQTVLTAIIDKVSNNPKYLVRYSSILSSLEKTFITNLPYEEITSIIKEQLSSLNKWEVESISLDGTGQYNVTYSMGNMQLYVMVPNETTVNNAKNKINEYLKQ